MQKGYRLLVVRCGFRGNGRLVLRVAELKQQCRIACLVHRIHSGIRPRELDRVVGIPHVGRDGGKQVVCAIDLGVELQRPLERHLGGRQLIRATLVLRLLDQEVRPRRKFRRRHRRHRNRPGVAAVRDEILNLPHVVQSVGRRRIDRDN